MWYGEIRRVETPQREKRSVCAGALEQVWRRCVGGEEEDYVYSSSDWFFFYKTNFKSNSILIVLIFFFSYFISPWFVSITIKYQTK